MNIFRVIALSFSVILWLTSCSVTPKVTSEFNRPATPSGQTGNLASLSGEVERVSFDDIVFYVSNDESNLYVLVDIISRQRYQHISEFGFTLYVNNKNTFRRSFGITYPTGMYYQLQNFPGAQQGFIEEPNWSNFPENQSLEQSARRNSVENALLIQRDSRRDPMQPVTIPVVQLRAQNLQVHLDDDERSGRISFTIPLQTRSTSQFSPDVLPGETLDIGFEIDPVRLHDMDYRGGAPLVTSETAGGTSRSDAEQKNRERIGRIMMRMGEPYEKWARVTLSKPGEQ